MASDALITPCFEPGCDQPATADRTFGLNAVSATGNDVTVWFERRTCTSGHYLMVEVFEETDDA